jgi:hypothetical protein
VVGQVLHDDSGEDNARATADTDHRRHETDAAGHLPGRKLVADDPKAKRENAATDA